MMAGTGHAVASTAGFIFLLRRTIGGAGCLQLVLQSRQHGQHEESSRCQDENRNRGEGSRGNFDPEDHSGAKGLTETADENQGDGESKSHAKAVKHGHQRLVLHGKGLRTAKDDAVYHDQRDVEAE